MNHVTDQRPDGTERPPGPPEEPAAPVSPVSQGHPVLTFVAMAVAVGALLLAVAWTGVSSPRLWSPGGGGWSSGPTTYLVIDVRNDGAVPARVEDASAPDAPGNGQVLMSPGAVGAGRIEPTAFAPFTLAAGETRSFYIPGVKTCAPGQAETTVRFSPLVVEVRAPAGWRQHRTFPDRPGQRDQTHSCP